jgi:carbon-monoxide dehydrogenase iron sulfur subunit
MARVLSINADNCTGCRMCELACSSSKEGEFIPDRSRIRVIDNRLEGWSRPTVCLQCEQPMCMAACPEEAISKIKTEQGDPVVEIDADKCIGCRSCMVACPFGAISFFPKPKAAKCDLCGGSPQCVQFCFYDCLRFIELSDQQLDERAKNIKTLTGKACREIAQREVRRRQVSFSLEASRVTAPPSAEKKDDSIGLDLDLLLKRNND